LASRAAEQRPQTRAAPHHGREFDRDGEPSARQEQAEGDSRDGDQGSAGPPELPLEVEPLPRETEQVAAQSM
jgi:hypothetical protein